MVGISITFLVKNKRYDDHKIFYNEVDWKSTRQEKFLHLEQAKTIQGIQWKLLQPDAKQTWLTEGLHADFDSFMPMGSKEAKAEPYRLADTHPLPRDGRGPGSDL